MITLLPLCVCVCAREMAAVFFLFNFYGSAGFLVGFPCIKRAREFSRTARVLSCLVVRESSLADRRIMHVDFSRLFPPGNRLRWTPMKRHFFGDNFFYTIFCVWNSSNFLCSGASQRIFLFQPIQCTSLKR